MAQWDSLSLDKLIPADDMQSIIDAAEAAVTTMEVVADTMNASAALVKAAMITYVDPIQEALELVLTTINEFIGDFENTGGYILLIPPRLLNQVRVTGVRAIDTDALTLEREQVEIPLPPWWPLSRSMDEMIGTIEASFYDYGDPQRPNFSAGSSVAGMVGVISVPTPTPQQLLTVITSLVELFGVPFLDEFMTIARVLKESAIADWTKDLPSPPPGATSLSGSSLALPKPYLDVEKEDLFPPTGEVLVKEPLLGEWKFPTPISYVKEGNRLWLDAATVQEYKTFGESSPSSGGTAILDLAQGDWVLFSKRYWDESYDLRSDTRNLWNEWPDWRRVASMGQMFGFTYDILSAIKAMAAIVDTGLSAVDAVDSAIDAFVTRIEELTSVVDEVKDFLEKIPVGLATTGLHYVFLEGEGTDGFVTALQEAADRPEVPDTSLSIGIVLVGGVAGVNVIKNFFFPDA